MIDEFYILGCGVSFIMILTSGWVNERTLEGKVEVEDGIVIFFTAIMGSILSWSLPIWYIGSILCERIKK